VGVRGLELSLSACVEAGLLIVVSSGWLEKNEERIVCERIATAMISSDRNFWEEVKRIRSHSTVSSSTVDAKYTCIYGQLCWPYIYGTLVDGISDTSCISKLFVDKY